MVFIEVKGSAFGTGMQVLPPYSGGGNQKLSLIFGIARHYL